MKSYLNRSVASLALVALLGACGSMGNNSASSISSLRVAQAAAASGDTQLSESVYATASADAPRDTQVQLAYADTLIRANKIQQARNVLASHVKTVRDPQLLRGPLGAIYVIEGNATQAIIELDAAISADPNNTRHIINKAIALDMLGKHTDAQALYRQALAAEPDDYIATNNLALSLALSGNKAEAARVASALSGRSDLPQRVTLTSDVLRAANGGDISRTRDEVGPESYDQMMKLARAIDTGAKAN